MANERGATIISTFRYRDAPKAIEFLCRAFGFKKHTVYGIISIPSWPAKLRRNFLRRSAVAGHL